MSRLLRKPKINDFRDPKISSFGDFRAFSRKAQSIIFGHFTNPHGIACKKKQPFLEWFSKLKNIVTPIISDILRLLVLVKSKIFFEFRVFEFTLSRWHEDTGRKTEILTARKQLRNTLSVSCIPKYAFYSLQNHMERVHDGCSSQIQII